jgi:fatty acid desaturase
MSGEEKVRQQREKQEKQEEKEEKTWDEKWRRDPLSAAVWATILIWVGLVLFLGNLNLLSWLPVTTWSLFFIGAGAILLLEVGFRLLSPSYRQPVIGTVIVAAVLLTIGLGSIITWQCVLPVAVIGAGLYLLFSVFFRRR